MFDTFTLNYDQTLFGYLESLTRFEQIAKGRKGAVLADLRVSLSQPAVPIIRTTTVYNLPVQNFLPVHYIIMNDIRSVSGLPLEFNNAMIEVYDNEYKRMGYHSDQALDLADDSWIGIFSCYARPAEPNDIRKLKIKSKENKVNKFDVFEMQNNSVIIFNTSTNKKCLHKIILETETDNKWLGITFRLSKSFVKFIDGIPYLNGKVLKIASEAEAKEYYAHRKNENKQTDYVWPEIEYTISPSDLIAQ